MAGIPGQVMGDLSGIGESALKQTVKASADIATKTMEVLTTTPSQAAAKAASEEKGGAKNDPQAQAKKKAEDKQRFEAVKGELAQYMQRKKQLDQQIEREKAGEQQQADRKNAVEKKKRESWAAQFFKKIGGASHGETSKQKE